MRKTKPNSNIRVAFEEIGPEIAKRYLARNIANRNLREATVRSYEIDMRRGNWVPTHQGIAFNDRGDLIDGQHRLTALARAGVTVKILVTRGLPSESGRTKTMDAVDVGAIRSVRDHLKLQHGFRNPYRDVAAATSIVHMIVGKTGVRKISVPQILGVLEVYGRHIADIGGVMDASREKRLRRSQFIGPLAFARAVEPNVVDRFLAGVIKGANLSEDSPILAFRNFLFSDASIRWTTSGLKDVRTEFAFIVLNSLRRFAQAETSKQVHTGRGGFVFFAKKQPENVKRIAKIFLRAPAPFDAASPDEPVREGKSLECLATRLVKSAKDIQLTPLAEELIAGVDSRTRNRLRSGALEA
jgi:hypothetical protein